MAKTYSCIGIIRYNTSDEPKIRFTDNLAQRLTKFKPLENWARLDFVEFDKSCSKQELLSLAIEHENFTSAEDQWLLSKELARLSKVEKKREYKSALTNISAEELLEAIK